MADTSLRAYGEDVFSEEAIRSHLTKGVAAKLLATTATSSSSTRPATASRGSIPFKARINGKRDRCRWKV